MALLYKNKLILWPLILMVFQGLFCAEKFVQSVKIVNETNAELAYNHTAPDHSITYIHMVSTECPRAYITNFNPASHGNVGVAQELNQRNPLPIFIRIGFDREVTQTFIDDFFAALKATNSLFKQINPVRHGLFRKEFVIRINPHYIAKEIEVFVEQANIAMYKKMLNEISSSVKNQ